MQRGRIRAPRWRHAMSAWALLAIVNVVPVATVQAAQSSRYVGEIAAECLPADLPSFLRTTSNAADIGEFVREADRLRGAGAMYDSAHNPEHFLELDEAGRTRSGLAIAEFPSTRDADLAQLAASSASAATEGVLPYAISERWEQLRQDFAYWRVGVVAARQWRDPAQRAWLMHDMRRRQQLNLRDTGDLGHFAADIKAPLHVSARRQDWINNKGNSERDPEFRMYMYVQGEFIMKFVTEDEVRRAMPPLSVCADPVLHCLATSVRSPVDHMAQLAQMVRDGGLAPSDPCGIALMAQITSEQAALTRDLVVKAWCESATQSVGYGPGMVRVADVERGQTPTFEQMHGWD